jgi:hypothetical protein
MRRTITISDTLHSWLQKIRASYLNEHEIDLSYTAAFNYYLGIGIGTALGLIGKELENFANNILISESIDAASIQDEADNLWLATELPKIMKKVKEQESEKLKKDTKYKFN